MPFDLPRLRSLVHLFVRIAPMAWPVACGAGLAGGPSDPDPTSDPTGLLGNPAPDFRVDAMVGTARSVALKDLQGSVVIVDFWGTYCGPCKHSFPKLQDLSAAFAARGVHVVAISEDEAEDKNKIAPFAAAYGAKFTIGWDEDKAIARRYKPDVMPSTYIIDKKGVVRFVHVGYHDGDEVSMRKEVLALLAQ